VESVPTPLPVSVVIVTWNSAEYIGPCLESIGTVARRPAEIVVVDNASMEGTLEIVRATAPEAEILPLGTNTGFCHAANRGIAATRSPLVLVLNPDTRLTPTFLEELLPAFHDPRVGLAGGKLLRFDGVTIDSAGQMLGRSRQPIDRGYGTRDVGQLDRDEEVFGVCGAAVVYRRKMIEDVSRANGQFYDEEFFAFYEDLDVAWRARKKGWRAAYRHRAVALHARGGTAADRRVSSRGQAFLYRDAVLRYHIAKNRYLTMLRNDRVADYLAHWPFIFARDLLTFLALVCLSPRAALYIWETRGLFRRALDLRAADRAV
jgi:GT2 family glycosyltransferase